MKDTKREWNMLTKEERSAAVKDIIAYFLDERDEDMDMIGAGELLDMFLQNIAPKVYNKAIEDAQTVLKKQAEDADFELGVLKK
jgi:uncharacterized protein (DUF2164 family)